MENLIQIPGYPGYYADPNGSIWSDRTGKLKQLNGNVANTGYIHVTLRYENEKGRKTVPVHTLVAAAFMGKRPENCQARHLDGNKLNNNPKNLAWGTPTENARDKHRHGKTAKGSGHGRSKLSESDIPTIFTLNRNGLSERKIAVLFEVSSFVIHSILKRRLWKHVSITIP